MSNDKANDAIALLKADHRKVEGLFVQFEEAKAFGADETRCFILQSSEL